MPATSQSSRARLLSRKWCKRTADSPEQGCEPTSATRCGVARRGRLCTLQTRRWSQLEPRKLRLCMRILPPNRAAYVCQMQLRSLGFATCSIRRRIFSTVVLRTCNMQWRCHRVSVRPRYSSMCLHAMEAQASPRAERGALGNSYSAESFEHFIHLLSKLQSQAT